MLVAIGRVLVVIGRVLVLVSACGEVEEKVAPLKKREGRRNERRERSMNGGRGEKRERRMKR